MKGKQNLKEKANVALDPAEVEVAVVDAVEVEASLDVSIDEGVVAVVEEPRAVAEIKREGTATQRMKEELMKVLHNNLIPTINFSNNYFKHRRYTHTPSFKLSNVNVLDVNSCPV